MITVAPEERNEVFNDLEYYSYDSTNPGVALVVPVTKRSDTGGSTPRYLATWDQLRLLGVQTEWLNYPFYLFGDRTGNSVAVIFTTAEGCSSQATEDERSQFPSFETQIAAIRSSLSLQMKELAETVGVERPTIYSWINEQNSPQPANRQRLNAIYRLAQQWNRLTNKPLGKALHSVDTEGRSVFDLLREDSIPTSAILERFRVLANAAEQDLGKNPTSVRELARKHDIDLSRIADSQDDIDLETGKRIGDD